MISKLTLLILFSSVLSCTVNAQVSSLTNSNYPASDLPDASMAAFYTDQYVWNKMARAFQVKTQTPVNLDWELWATTDYAYNNACAAVAWPTEGLPPGALNSPKLVTILDASNNTPDNFSTTQFAILTLNFTNPYYEELRINKPMFDYIQSNGLYDQNVVYAMARQGKFNFPEEAMMIKAQWIPMDTVESSQAGLYYTKVIDGYDAVAGIAEHTGTDGADSGEKLMGLVGFHLVTHELPNWVWSTFEFSGNPGLCDHTGCKDEFGSIPAYIPPNKDVNQGYSQGTTSPELLALFDEFDIPAEFKNYRLKGSQTEYTDVTGKPTRLGNSILEANLVRTSSCISCHVRATLNNNADGRENLDMFTTEQSLVNFTPATDKSTLGFHPITFMGTPIPEDYLNADSNGTVEEDSIFYQTNFMWQLAQDPKPCTTSSSE